MITTCPKCNTFDGRIERTSFSTRRRLKPILCTMHTSPIASCDVCGVTCAMVIRHAFIGRPQQSWEPIAFGDWEFLATGGKLPPGWNGHMADQRVHVCGDCAKAVREAQQVAMDRVVEARGGLRSSVVDGQTP